MLRTEFHMCIIKIIIFNRCSVITIMARFEYTLRRNITYGYNKNKVYLKEKTNVFLFTSML